MPSVYTLGCRMPTCNRVRGQAGDGVACCSETEESAGTAGVVGAGAAPDPSGATPDLVGADDAAAGAAVGGTAWSSPCPDAAREGSAGVMATLDWRGGDDIDVAGLD